MATWHALQAMTRHLIGVASGHGPQVTLALACFAAIALAALGASRAARKLLAGRKAEDITTVIAAGIATAVSATGMWMVFGKELHFPVWLRIGLFAFMEIALITSALRARRATLTSADGSSGVDGIAVWVLAILSGIMSALAATSAGEVVVRLAAPLVAAWLWERGLSLERHRIRGTKGIRWRVTPERVLVRLGIADASDRTADDVDAHRRLSRVARTAMNLRALRNTGAPGWRIRRSERRLEKAMRQAVEYAHLATDMDRQRQLLAQIAALYNAPALAEMTPAPPWQVMVSNVGEGAGKPDVKSPGKSPRKSQAKPSSKSPGKSLAKSPANAPGKAPGKAGGKSQPADPRDRTNDELITEIHKIIAARGEDAIKVQPIAKQLHIGRDRARILLDRMNVRPLHRKASSE